MLRVEPVVFPVLVEATTDLPSNCLPGGDNIPTSLLGRRHHCWLAQQPPQLAHNGGSAEQILSTNPFYTHFAKETCPRQWLSSMTLPTPSTRRINRCAAATHPTSHGNVVGAEALSTGIAYPPSTDCGLLWET